MREKQEVIDERESLRQQWHNLLKRLKTKRTFVGRETLKFNMILLENEIGRLDWVLEDYDTVGFWKRNKEYNQ